jgi:hypothetical protein
MDDSRIVMQMALAALEVDTGAGRGVLHRFTSDGGDFARWQERDHETMASALETMASDLEADAAKLRALRRVFVDLEMVQTWRAGSRVGGPRC